MAVGNVTQEREREKREREGEMITFGKSCEELCDRRDQARDAASTQQRQRSSTLKRARGELAQSMNEMKEIQALMG